jgi:LmbE family N-acetylglucosaminyl deacetylase
VKRESLIRVSLFSLLTSLFLNQALAAGLDTLRLQPNERIVIVAPHPDDEVLACGGLIQQALALGDSVWVVYVTSGDGSWPSAWRVTGNMLPDPAGYLALGRTRIEEAKAGAQVLGLDTTHLIFLGYPDGELDRLIFEHHFDTEPVISTHTGVSSNPYCQSQHGYRGVSVAEDLYDEVARHRTDRVFFPHPLDAHPDHWATAALLPAIRDFWRRGSPDRAFPVTYHYLVHRPPYPNACIDDAGNLDPPAELTVPGHHWYTLPVTAPAAEEKQAAVKCQWSQFVTLGPDMAAYVAGNELFAQAGCDSGTARGDAPATGFLPGPRIDSVTASLSSPGRSVFRLFLRGTPASGLDYRLYLWSFGPVIIDHTVDLKEDTSEQGRANVRLLAADARMKTTEPVCAASDGGWVAYLPSKWFNDDFMVYFTADARWKGNLLDHAGVGWVVPSRY